MPAPSSFLEPLAPSPLHLGPRAPPMRNPASSPDPFYAAIAAAPLISLWPPATKCVKDCLLVLNSTALLCKNLGSFLRHKKFFLHLVALLLHFSKCLLECWQTGGGQEDQRVLNRTEGCSFYQKSVRSILPSLSPRVAPLFDMCGQCVGHKG